MPLYYYLYHPENRDMNKPWDNLRVSPKKHPIGAGTFQTSGYGVPMLVGKVVNRSVIMGTGSEYHSSVHLFNPTDLRELAEFCAELADQLDGK